VPPGQLVFQMGSPVRSSSWLVGAVGEVVRLNYHVASHLLIILIF
jgi:hypothetical protein